MRFSCSTLTNLRHGSHPRTPLLPYFFFSTQTGNAFSSPTQELLNSTYAIYHWYIAEDILKNYKTLWPHPALLCSTSSCRTAGCRWFKTTFINWCKVRIFLFSLFVPSVTCIYSIVRSTCVVKYTYTTSEHTAVSASLITSLFSLLIEKKVIKPFPTRNCNELYISLKLGSYTWTAN